jgi:membrane protease YdiL (CAAX protease family)
MPLVTSPPGDDRDESDVPQPAGLGGAPDVPDDPIDPQQARRRANQAILVTAAVYVAYGVSGLVPIPGDVRYLLLIAAFYFLPAWVLRADPQRQRRWQVGPGGVIPPVTRAGLRWAGIAALVVFPPFVVGFLWFYARVCAGDLAVLAPVTGLESVTPWAGGLERYLGGLCRRYGDSFWPTGWAVPAEWLAWGGLGALLAIAVEVLAIAMPEEVFHRGYLMSALEERWPPRRRVLGVPLGIGAVLASALFALGHLVGMAEVARLATFFPALVFSWLFRRSGSLWAPALFHAASNLLMAVLLASTFPR